MTIKETIREKHVRLAKHHRDADMLIDGVYWDGGRGCSVGCLAHDLGTRPGDQKALADALDVPEWLIRLADGVFEGLPAALRRDWHVRWAEACAARHRDWQTVHHDVMVGILRIAERHAGDALPAVVTVRRLHEDRAPADDPQWAAAWRAVRAAARDATWAAVWAAARAAEWGASRGAAKDAAKDAASGAALASASAAAKDAAKNAAGDAARGAARSAAGGAAWTMIVDLTIAAIVAPALEGEDQP